MSKQSKLDFERAKSGLILRLEGVAIAERGQRGSDYPKSWVPLELGCEIIDALDGSILVHRSGFRVH
ncbi:hypothetical protein JQ544_11520 [Bradyrhizobium diazoefficiens]|nr:hypothetical protein [Bradyrhizobium diazoefficiens]MBR0812156.1 hypothetical protein [Bradyrhizobium diazoefficiens]